MTLEEVLTQALPGPMQESYWYTDGAAAELSKMTGQAIKLWRPEAYAHDLLYKLTAAGYSLVPTQYPKEEVNPTWDTPDYGISWADKEQRGEYV
jgi:cell wall assembly regulator SMI1